MNDFPDEVAFFSGFDPKKHVLPKLFLDSRRCGKRARIGHLVLKGKAIGIVCQDEKGATEEARYYKEFGLGLINAKIIHEHEDDMHLWVVFLTKKKGARR